MPTGYTAAIKDDTTFAEWAAVCARNFGALILMRDEPGDAPIPERFEPSSYHKDGLAEARAELAELERMTNAEIEARQAPEIERERASHMERERGRIATVNRYARMRALVEGWTPPTPEHDGMKRFMLQQIDDSVKFDCTPREQPTTKPVAADEWRRRKQKAVKEGIEYHSKAWAEECARTEDRNRWIANLRVSLKAYGR